MSTCEDWGAGNRRDERARAGNRAMESEKTVSQESREMEMESPTASQKTVSDDDEIDYSIKPEFYDPNLDDKDDLWAHKNRRGHISDAILSCPACFTTLCIDCQRHEKYVSQYRAIFTVNCKIKTDQVLRQSSQKSRKGKNTASSSENKAAAPALGETFKPVCCMVCSTEVGVIDEDQVYHFFNVLPSES
ncbi:hypothetical protein Syun_021903 [Stephania yunnanensis]|uniref:E2F-associated phosphoprotein n=1 Tax=Stephania yunnanensis TaxID=152371 RepID=A0AAP0NSP1_9MAGN